MKEILDQFNLSEEDFDINPLGNGLINTTWRIRNDDEDYVLQEINVDIFKHPEYIAQNVSRIAVYLNEKFPDYLFPHPLAGKDGKEVVFLENRGYFRITKFVKNSRTISEARNEHQAFEAAQQFGKFARLLADFPVEELKITLPEFHNLELRYEQFLSAISHGNKERINNSKDLIEYLESQKSIVDTYSQIITSPAFHTRVTHHDTKISNVLFDQNDDGLCVIDLDTVMPGYFFNDVGDMMRTYLSPVNEEEKDFSKIEVRDLFYKAIYDGYIGEVGDIMSAEEKDHFFYAGKFMIYMQAIRFLTDYLNNDIYYGEKYEGHNFVRAGNQVSLLKKYMDKEGRLRRIIGQR